MVHTRNLWHRDQCICLCVRDRANLFLHVAFRATSHGREHELYCISDDRSDRIQHMLLLRLGQAYLHRAGGRDLMSFSPYSCGPGSQEYSIDGLLTTKAQLLPLMSATDLGLSEG